MKVYISTSHTRKESFICVHNDSFKLLVYDHTFHFKMYKGFLWKMLNNFRFCVVYIYIPSVDRPPSIALVAHVQNRRSKREKKKRISRCQNSKHFPLISFIFTICDHRIPNSLHAFFKATNERNVQHLSHHFRHWQPRYLRQQFTICYDFQWTCWISCTCSSSFFVCRRCCYVYALLQRAGKIRTMNELLQ